MTHDRYYVGDWRKKLVVALREMFETTEMREVISKDHISRTPERFLIALDEYFIGVNKDPASALTLFNRIDLTVPAQMIHVGGFSFYSMCCHHLAPFFGRMHFAYIPDESLVGLSKIPRLMEIFSRRPQIQEKLTDDIVDAFQDLVKPKGCALLVRATHFCMEARGVRAHGCETTTTALRGIFTEEKVKQEFLDEASRLTWRV